MDKEQIKKALECCKGDDLSLCRQCEYHIPGDPICIVKMAGDALALINSQEQRIKELDEENERLGETLTQANELIGKLQEQRQKLTEENERLKNRITCQVVIPDEKLEEIKNECLERVELDVKAVQADTLEEYRKGVYRKMEKYTIFGREYMQRIMREVAKEMLECVGDAGE